MLHISVYSKELLPNYYRNANLPATASSGDSGLDKKIKKEPPSPDCHMQKHSELLGVYSYAKDKEQ